MIAIVYPFPLTKTGSTQGVPQSAITLRGKFSMNQEAVLEDTILTSWWEPVLWSPGLPGLVGCLISWVFILSLVIYWVTLELLILLDICLHNNNHCPVSQWGKMQSVITLYNPPPLSHYPMRGSGTGNSSEPVSFNHRVRIGLFFSHCLSIIELGPSSSLSTGCVLCEGRLNHFLPHWLRTGW